MDPHSFFPDSAVWLSADPDPAVCLSADPDPGVFLVRIRIQLNTICKKLCYEKFSEKDKQIAQK